MNNENPPPLSKDIKKLKILLIAPQPFFQERGTPIAVDLLLKVLAKRGDNIDILTYHEGSDTTYSAQVALHRIRKPPFARRIRPGFSFKKVLCDCFMLPKALKMAKKRHYDLVHAVEESVFLAMLIRRLYGIPYVYDMDSSMPEQIAEKLPFLRFLLPLMRRCERSAIRNAVAVVPVCDSLAAIANMCGAGKVAIIRDISLLNPGSPPSAEDDMREQLDLTGPCFMYVGNLESYQGIDLLLESFAVLLKKIQNAVLVIVGGTRIDIGRYEKKTTSMKIHDSVRFIGPRPLHMMGRLFDAADVLVSPRVTGVNVPMKIYSYLHSGKPILATNIPGHTQVLDCGVSVLRSPRPQDFAAGMLQLAEDVALRTQLGKKGMALAEKQYSFTSFEKAVLELYEWIENVGSSSRQQSASTE